MNGSGNAEENKYGLKEGISKHRQRHGDRHTRLYSIWTNMKTRCCNESATDYDKYGGRGIGICDEWINDYLAFKNWALSNGYDETLSIDRIDVNGPYSPQNCRWANAKTQANNRTNTIFVTAHNQTHSLSEWSSLSGVRYHTLYARLFKLHMSPQEAIPLHI